MSDIATNEPMPEKEPADDITQAANSSDMRQALLNDIGNKLAAARMSLLQELDEPARKLKLRKKHLDALESGKWDAMPDEVYAMGFLRQYSAYLHLDLTEEIERLKNSAYTLTRPLTFPDPPVAPSRRWAWIAAAMFIILIVAFNFLYQDLGSHRPSSEIAALSGQATSPDQSGNMSAPPESITAPSVTAQTEDSDAVPTGTDSLPASDEAIATREDTVAPQSDAIQTMASSLPAEAATDNADSIGKADVPQPAVSHTYRFEAVDSAVWIQVSLPNQAGNGKGSLIKEALLQPGHHISLSQPVDALWITCGNAPSLRIIVDGKVLAETGSLDTGRKVLRDHRISSNGDQ